MADKEKITPQEAAIDTLEIIIASIRKGEITPKEISIAGEMQTSAEGVNVVVGRKLQMSW